MGLSHYQRIMTRAELLRRASERASEQLSRFRELNEKATKGENFIKSNYYYINVLEKEKIKEAKISALLKFLFTVVNVTH